MASRTAVSPRRSRARARKRWAMLAQASSNTRPTITVATPRNPATASRRPPGRSDGGPSSTRRPSWVAGNRSASAAARGSRPASARSVENPGRRRPIVWKRSLPRSSRHPAPNHRPDDSAGVHTSIPAPAKVPVNSFGTTPTTVNGSPFRITLAPSTEGSPPKLARQKAWPSIATRSPARLSSGDSVRPSAGVIPRAGKKLPETTSARTWRLSPPAVSDSGTRLTATRSEKASPRSR